MRARAEKCCEEAMQTGSAGIDSFCHLLHRTYRSLQNVRTEGLARLYRVHFNLPLILTELTLERHCRDLGLGGLNKQPLPTRMSAYNQEHNGTTTVLINAQQWSGIHALALFHETFEILNRRFAALYEPYTPLHGVILERRANRFASCVLLPSEESIDLFNLLSSTPSLLLFMGESALGAVHSRMRSVLQDKYPFIFVRYERARSQTCEPDLRATYIRIDRTKEFLPSRARRILLSHAPRIGNGYETGWIANLAFEYQGPVLLARNMGFDFFGRHDLSMICVPLLVEGEITDLLIFGVKADAYPHLIETFGRLDPKIVREEFQVF